MCNELIYDEESKVKTPHVLLKYEGNWADELDVEGAAIVTREDWEVTVQAVKEYFGSGENRKLSNWIGTNEEIVYTSFDDWYSDYDVYSLPFPVESVKLLKDVMDQLSLPFYWPEWDDEDMDE